VNDVDLFLSNEMNQTAKLFDEVEIVEALSAFVNFSDTQFGRLRRAASHDLQAGEMNAAFPVVCNWVKSCMAWRSLPPCSKLSMMNKTFGFIGKIISTNRFPTRIALAAQKTCSSQSTRPDLRA